MKLILIAIVAMLCCSATALFGGRSKEFGLVPPPESHNLSAPDLEAKWFDQRLDHFDNTNLATYSQRYFVSGEFFDISNDQAPVFVYIGSEGPLSSKWLQTGLIYDYAKRTGALMYALEHRFYGSSQPVGDWTSRNLSYLSSSQALADLANFIEAQNMPNRPWVVFGGSYGGSLSAWARLKYPHLIHASIAASGPLEPKVDFTEYLQVVDSAFKWYGGNACLDNFHSALAAIDGMMRSDSARDRLSEDLKLCTALPTYDSIGPLDLQTFWELQFDTSVGIVQYNKENSGQLTVSDACTLLADGETPYAGFVELRSRIVAASGEKCMSWGFKGFVDEVADTQIDFSKNMRQWTWQTCTEFGFFQTSNADPKWGNFNITLFDEMCQGAFGPEFNIHALNENAKRTNATYGSVDYRQTNTLFTNGNIDPWHALSITEDIKRPVPVKTWFTPGTSHCAILYPTMPYDRPELNTAREEVFQELSKILKQFF